MVWLLTTVWLLVFIRPGNCILLSLLCILITKLLKSGRLFIITILLLNPLRLLFIHITPLLFLISSIFSLLLLSSLSLSLFINSILLLIQLPFLFLSTLNYLLFTLVWKNRWQRILLSHGKFSYGTLTRQPFFC
jgi:hypothetical protein